MHIENVVRASASSAESGDPGWGRIAVRRQSTDGAADGLPECVYRRAAHRGRYATLAAPANRGGSRGADGSVPAGPGASTARDDRGRRCDPNLLIVDDCTLYRENLAAVFAKEGCPPPRVAWDLPTLFTALTEDSPDLVLINLDTRDSIMLLQSIFEIAPGMRVIVLGVSEDDEAGIVACAEAGVAGYHLRTEALNDLLTLIRKVADGEPSCSAQISAILLRRLSLLANQRQPVSRQPVLTAREAQILRLLEMGLSNRDIAAELRIALHTVKNHVHSLLTKLGVSTRAEAAARFRSVRFKELDREI